MSAFSNREQVSILIALGMGLGEEVFLQPDDLAASFFQNKHWSLGVLLTLHGGYDFLLQPSECKRIPKSFINRFFTQWRVRTWPTRKKRPRRLQLRRPNL